MSRQSRRVACLVSPAAAALLLAACGGSSSHGVASAPVQAARTVQPIPKLLGSVGSARVQASRSGPVKARNQAGMIDDEVNASGAKPLNPCTLVSRSQARAILGKPVGQPVQAPQGPTCIYRLAGGKRFVTLAVESLKFSTVKPQAQLRDRMSVTVAGHVAYCGVAGGPMMLIPLSAGRVMAVTAPCPIAASFARRALGHITTG